MEDNHNSLWSYLLCIRHTLETYTLRGCISEPMEYHGQCLVESLPMCPRILLSHCVTSIGVGSQKHNILNGQQGCLF